MQPPKPIVKILTLAMFAVLLSGFVAYRSGAFNRERENKTITAFVTIDTIPQKDTPPSTFFSSSKFIMVHKPVLPGKSIDLKTLAVQDSLNRMERIINALNSSRSKKDSAVKRRMMMSSSKSGILLEPLNDTIDKLLQKN